MLYRLESNIILAELTPVERALFSTDIGKLFTVVEKVIQRHTELESEALERLSIPIK